jgi:putative membrane protein
MNKPSKTSMAVMGFGCLGLGLLVFLLVRHNLRDIGKAIAVARWGVPLVIAFHIVPMITNAYAWQVLFPAGHRLRLLTLAWMYWLGESVSALLPVTQVGGGIVRARLTAMRGVSVARAAAIVVVDVTLGLAAQIVFTLAGVFLLARLTGRGSVTGQFLTGALIAVIAVGGFYAVQRVGISRIASFFLSRLSRSSSWQGVKQNAQAVDKELVATYGRRRGAVVSFVMSVVTWVVGAGEVWIAMRALGLPGGVAQALVLESLCQGVRAAMFPIPGGLGVQEGGYVVVGALLGIPAETALALALIRRVRELAFAIPGFVAWQWTEGRRLWRRTPRQPRGKVTPAPSRASALRS